MLVDTDLDDTDWVLNAFEIKIKALPKRGATRSSRATLYVLHNSLSQNIRETQEAYLQYN